MRLEPHPLSISPNDIKPSDVLRAAERGIPQASTKQAPKVSTVSHIHLEEIGTEDVLLLGEHTVWHRKPSFLLVIGCLRL
ncbi:hypothetical protein OJAV_G00064040 [Oryzias javanicus]|uniref:Uncharacterized protein n=1 Tax=Oryzias javanicus TaxID=123683 RepID=A0A3S2Q548_ORYJA|nr:hypothetical protein OJAV_G00064040 [Oryzias javanicus]